MSSVLPSGDLRDPDNPWGALFSGMAPGFAAADSAATDEVTPQLTEPVDEEDAISTNMDPRETVVYSLEQGGDAASDGVESITDVLLWLIDNRTAVGAFVLAVASLYLLQPVLKIGAAVVD